MRQTKKAACAGCDRVVLPGAFLCRCSVDAGEKPVSVRSGKSVCSRGLRGCFFACTVRVPPGEIRLFNFYILQSVCAAVGIFLPGRKVSGGLAYAGAANRISSAFSRAVRGRPEREARADLPENARGRVSNRRGFRTDLCRHGGRGRRMCRAVGCGGG